jgi:DNA-binding response OmpR family regulator
VGEQVTVVVVDDERPLADLVARYLTREGYRVEVAYDGPAGLELIARLDPDVIVLDLMLPGIDGLEVARRVRATSDAYLVMLTARSDEVDRIVGLRVGADDYVTKPFSVAELVARIQAMLRRPRRGAVEPDGERQVGALRIDPASHQAWLADAPLVLTPIEFALLERLSAAPRQVWSKEQLLEQVWGSASYRDPHVVAVHVGNLRRKLSEAGDRSGLVDTVRGVGYRLVGS